MKKQNRSAPKTVYTVKGSLVTIPADHGTFGKNTCNLSFFDIYADDQGKLGNPLANELVINLYSDDDDGDFVLEDAIKNFSSLSKRNRVKILKLSSEESRKHGHRSGIQILVSLSRGNYEPIAFQSTESQ